MINVTRAQIEKMGGTYHVAPEDQGQIVEVAYACLPHEGILVRRTEDKSDRSVSYAVASLDALPGDFDPWNKPPSIDDEWQVVAE